MTYTTAKVIAKTQHPEVPSAVITTVQIYAPRFILAEINTHGVIAKSAASSRAIPLAKRIDMVQNEGFIPIAFGVNKPGMQAEDVLKGDDDMQARLIWEAATSDMLHRSKQLAALGVHKQHANRLLEPFAYFHGVITATEWDNFFALRIHPDAQPEFDELARLMKTAIDGVQANVSYDHIPWCDDLDWSKMTYRELFDVSAARSARVSYQTHDGKPFSLEADQARCKALIAGGHMSPFDHAARADVVEWYKVSGRTAGLWHNPELHRRFWGWIPDRVEVERIADMPPSRRSSFDAIKV